jgi:CelD/BcsL family acetyltransferase involved in cellulose biosynthesis
VDAEHGPESRLAAHTLTPHTDLASARSAWTDLAERSGNVFSTWEWASAWWRQFGRDGSLRVVEVRRSDGSPAAILPLYEASRRPLRIVRIVGHGLADQLGPISAPADRTLAATSLLHTLSGRSPSWDLVLADRLPRVEGWRELTSGTVVRQEPSPVLGIDGKTWDDFLASRSANFRSQVRGRERKLVRNHGLRYRLTERPGDLTRDLGSLYSLHRARWGGISDAFSPKRWEFHKEFAAQALARGWLRLWIAEVEGRPIAAWYGFRFGDADWYYQAGRDPAWERSSVGFALLTHTMRESFEDGMREYRLLLGDESYKDRFATDDPGLETIVVTGAHPRGAAAGLLTARLPSIVGGRVVRRLLDRGTRG